MIEHPFCIAFAALLVFSRGFRRFMKNVVVALFTMALLFFAFIVFLGYNDTPIDHHGDGVILRDRALHAAPLPWTGTSSSEFDQIED
jgi:hypothetical protein